ncbi:MAG: hypothetical protein IPK74_31195 [Deltaproteobacteria bacterium]|nr:hypothetical protein [Deltaproteobacteria bacterium]
MSSMNRRAFSTFLASAWVNLAGCGGYFPGDCYVHCWEASVESSGIQDAIDPMGFYDQACTNFGGGALWAPLPTDESLPGRACFDNDQSQHDLMKLAIELKLDGRLDELTPSESSEAETLMQRVADSVRQTCVSLLTCSYAPGTCDIRPDLAGDQSCTVSLNSICSSYVLPLAEASLNLETGPDVPTYSGSSTILIDYQHEDCEFIPDGLTTGQTIVLDDTGVFGDITSWVTCGPQTSCTVDQALMWNLAARFDQFYAEGVSLTFGNTGTPCNATGATISGLGPGEESKKLADAFDFRNGDVVTMVEGVSLSSASNASLIIDDLQSTTDPITLTIRRRTNSKSCQTLNYTLTLSGY